MPKSDETQAMLNTDRELWREKPGDYYSHSIHVTEGGAIGINVGGTVIVKPLTAWHRDHAIVERVRAFRECAKGDPDYKLSRNWVVIELDKALNSESPPQTLETTASAIAPPDERHGSGVIDDNYVAWLRYVNGTIKTCDSDSKGAFKVWRRPPAPAPSDERHSRVNAGKLGDDCARKSCGHTEWEHSRGRCSMCDCLVYLSIAEPAPAPSDARERAIEALYQIAANGGTWERCEAAVDAILAAAQPR